LRADGHANDDEAVCTASWNRPRLFRRVEDGLAERVVDDDRGLSGLIRKYYLFDAESRTGGGCYLWESREAAERVYNAEWRKMITERYGTAPEISYFETPVVVDNALGKTILDAAE